MAECAVTMACGHTELVGIEGDATSVEHVQTCMGEARDCAECRGARLADADIAHGTDGLPDLIGSPKQVAWAQTIRHETLRDLDECLGYILRHAQEAGRDAMVHVDAAREIAIALREQTQAGWWIDHRNRGTWGIVQTAMTPPGRFFGDPTITRAINTMRDDTPHWRLGFATIRLPE